MEIGNNDDFIDEIDDVIEEPTVNESDDSNQQVTSEQNNSIEPEPQQVSNETDFLSELLRSRGITDKSKIKFENDEGIVEEVDWDSLDNKDKLNILQSSERNPETDLDDAEIQLLNSIRSSALTTSEYLQHSNDSAVKNYINNSQQPSFEIDQYTDDELFLMDLLSRTGDITEDEAAEALDKAKANEGLYKKQVDAIRKEYQQIEYENKMQEQLEQDQQAEQQYKQFSNQIVDEINNLTEIQGFNLNMESDDMQTLYDFITGQDAAGNNYMAKALSDPRILVKTAWLALNGDQMVEDITNYFQKEITNVRKESYKKGMEDAQKKISKQNNVVFKDKSKSQQDLYSDLDDF